jgi:alkanesulfonate monooxygenase SsuD/methylene tetrahydromethanopterin reductase-like flavin-dependent oxidoreductase (luciferase family)
VSLRLGLGVFGMQAVPQRPDHHAKLYRDLLDDAELAESLGFDSIWLSEHHFWFDGYCPDLVAAGAIVGRTKRIRVGTAVMLLPMHPWKGLRRRDRRQPSSGGRLSSALRSAIATRSLTASCGATRAS